MHAADAQVYDVVKRIFEQRWRRAEREGWGSSPEKCGCAFVAGPCLRDAYGRCIPSDCESYHDGCNTCSIQDGRLDACTEMFCESPKEPRCLDVVGGPTGDKEQDSCCGGLCGNQISHAPRRNVVPVTASARWRGGSRRSTHNRTHWLIPTQAAAARRAATFMWTASASTSLMRACETPTTAACPTIASPTSTGATRVLWVRRALGAR